MTGEIECHYCGRDFTVGEMALLRTLIAAEPQSSRAALSREFCRRIGWLHVGTIQGHGRYDRHKLYDKSKKDVWLRPLRKKLETHSQSLEYGGLGNPSRADGTFTVASGSPWPDGTFTDKQRRKFDRIRLRYEDELGSRFGNSLKNRYKQFPFGRT